MTEARFPIFLVLAMATAPVLMLLAREYEIWAAWRQLRSSLSLESSRGLIERCYELLVDQYGIDTFAADQLKVTPASSGVGSERFQRLADLAGDRWQVTLPPLSFRLVPSSRPGVAGTYSRTTGCGYSLGHTEDGSVDLEWSQIHEIGLSPSVLSDDEALPIVIAHEIAHLVLHRDGVTIGNESDDEILTDVATALVGFGELMRRLRSRTRRQYLNGKRLGWLVSGPGYLHAEELEYLLDLHARRLVAAVNL